jgi:hypothetical protein
MTIQMHMVYQSEQLGNQSNGNSLQNNKEKTILVAKAI